MRATARANANIAFIKYWGNQDDALKIPANGSLSMNLEGLYAETTVVWQPTLDADRLTLNGEPASEQALARVVRHLNIIREKYQVQGFAEVVSQNNFPMGAGIASSAAAFAALSVAATHAAGLTLSERELTTLARLGSGSAARSVPTGFVEWQKGDTHETSFAYSVAEPSYWDLVDVIAVVSQQHKATGSEDGHKTAQTSDLQAGRLAKAQERLAGCREALLTRDFAHFAEVVELDSNLMHAVMMTSRPALFYWLPLTLRVMQAVREWRASGVPVCYTLDAGPNVHCLCLSEAAEQVATELRSIEGILDVRLARAGSGTVLL